MHKKKLQQLKTLIPHCEKTFANQYRLTEMDYKELSQLRKAEINTSNIVKT